MEHQVYKEWIPLAVDNELSVHEMAEFQKHIAVCGECTYEYEEQKKLKAFLLENNPAEPGEHLLFKARQQLRNAIRDERSKESLKNKLSSVFSVFSKKTFQLSFGGAAVLAVGIFTGYLLFGRENVQVMPGAAGTEMLTNTSEDLSAASSDMRITNIRFIDQDAKDGEVEFEFDAVKPVRVKGNINDEKIKNILTYSMLNVENPGVRLKSINAISSVQKPEVDSKVKAALISVAKFDENPGVRRQSIKLLSRINTDEDVKNTLMYVLMNDKISGNRIEAINSLMEAQKEGTKFTEDELSVFKEKMNADDNNYIRYQAKTVLMENK